MVRTQDDITVTLPSNVRGVPGNKPSNYKRFSRLLSNSTAHGRSHCSRLTTLTKSQTSRQQNWWSTALRIVESHKVISHNRIGCSQQNLKRSGVRPTMSRYMVNGLLVRRMKSSTQG